MCNPNEVLSRRKAAGGLIGFGIFLFILSMVGITALIFKYYGTPGNILSDLPQGWFWAWIVLGIIGTFTFLIGALIMPNIVNDLSHPRCVDPKEFE